MQLPIPPDEELRLQALADTRLLDTPPEGAFDRISRLAAQLFSTPIAAVSLIAEDRQFLKSVVGLNIRETGRDEAFCAHTILQHGPMLVLDALADPRFQENRLVTGDPGIRFYCGAPLQTADGYRIGAVCVMDTEPRTQVPDDLLHLLTELATQASAEIENRRKEEDLATKSAVLLERECELEREKHLRQQSEVHAELALEAGRMGAWDWNAGTGQLTASPLTHQLFHLLEPQNRSWRTWFRQVHVEDRRALLELVRAALSTLDSFAPEMRVIGPDGVVRWLAVKGRTVRSRDGQLQGAKGVCWDISDRRLDEERLRESEEVFRGISVSSPVGIFQCDRIGQIYYSNPRMQDICGATADELQGFGWLRFVHPEDGPGLLKDHPKPKTSGLQYEGEYRLVLPDGTIRWVYTRTAPLRDGSGKPLGSVGMVDDITERKRLEREQHTSQELTRSILESSKDRIEVLDLEGRLLLMSPGGRRALGVDDLPSLSGQTYFDLWQNEQDRSAGEAAFQSALAGGTASFQGYFPGVGGELRWWDTAFSPIFDKSGKPERVLAVSRDLTELRRASEEQENARRLAEEANQSKSLFLANVSHELRTPLNGVLATSEFLLNSQLNGEQRELTEVIRVSGEALLQLVNDLLDLGRMEAGKLTCRCEPFDLRTAIKQAVALVMPAAAAKQLDLSVRYLDSVPELLLGDAGRIRQILINYLNNAVKFTDHGSVSVLVSVDLLNPEARTLLLSVLDTGPGIAEEAQTDLFRPFKQVDGSTTRKHGGLGLGLAISAHLAEAMGGSVGLQSAVGEGSTFWVRLPLLLASPRSESPERQPREFPPVPLPAALNDLQVLVAEDNAINQRVTLQLLAKLGCKAEVAPNGEVAVQMFREKRYDMVLMDCQMPEVDGYEATRQIRGLEHRGELTRTPIVAVTAHGMDGDRERCLDSGMDDHLVKPLSLRSLQTALEKWSRQTQVPVKSL